MGDVERGRWRRAASIRARALLLGALSVAGCAPAPVTPRPADYPLHVAAPPVEIHYRLRVDADGALADGVVERQYPIQIAWLQLLGLDQTGRAVSFTAPIRVHWRSASALESFGARLRPRGGEQRFEMRLFSFEYPEEVSP